MNYMDKFKNLSHRSGLKLSEVKKIAFERTAEFLGIPIQKVEDEPCTKFSQRVELCKEELLRQLNECRIVIRPSNVGSPAKDIAKLAGIKFSSKVMVAALHKVFESYGRWVKFDDFYSTNKGGLTFKIVPNTYNGEIEYATDSYDCCPCNLSSSSYKSHFDDLVYHFSDIVKKATELKIIDFNSSEQELVTEYVCKYSREPLFEFSARYANESGCYNKAVYPPLAFSFAVCNYCQNNRISYKESDIDIACNIRLLDQGAFNRLLLSELTAIFSSPTA